LATRVFSPAKAVVDPEAIERATPVGAQHAAPAEVGRSMIARREVGRLEVYVAPGFSPASLRPLISSTISHKRQGAGLAVPHGGPNEGVSTPEASQ